MTPNPVSIHENASLRDAINLLIDKGFSAAPVIDDAGVEDRSAVLRIVLCSGKVFYDLAAARKKSNDARVAA